MAAAAQALPKKETENDAAGPAAVQPIAAGAEAGSLLTSYGYGHASPNVEVAPQPAAAPAAPHAPSPAAEVKTPEVAPKAPAAALKDISLQVPQPGAQNVQVRLVQQAGELRVAVHTGDSDLAHGLQQNLSDLVGRLQESGFRTEAWRPGVSAATSGPTFEARATAGGSQNNQSQYNPGGSQQQPGQRRQNQARPAWVEELENNLGSGKTS